MPRDRSISFPRGGSGYSRVQVHSEGLPWSETLLWSDKLLTIQSLTICPKMVGL